MMIRNIKRKAKRLVTGAFLLVSIFLLGTGLSLLCPGNTVLAAEAALSETGTETGGFKDSESAAGVPAGTSAAGTPARESEAGDSSEDEPGIAPAVIIAVLILPLLSIGLTIGTAVIMIQYRKSHPSPPPKEKSNQD